MRAIILGIFIALATTAVGQVTKVSVEFGSTSKTMFSDTPMPFTFIYVGTSAEIKGVTLRVGYTFDLKALSFGASVPVWTKGNGFFVRRKK